MAHFAEVVDGVVQRVIVAEQDFIDSGAVGEPSKWIKCSYNTRGGVHVLGGVPLRKNFPGPGWLYDGVGFYEPQPFPSWALNQETYLWEAPIPYPSEGLYRWDEAQGNWVEVPWAS